MGEAAEPACLLSTTSSVRVCVCVARRDVCRRRFNRVLLVNIETVLAGSRCVHKLPTGNSLLNQVILKF